MGCCADFNGTIPRNIANLTSPFGFAPSITNGTLPVALLPSLSAVLDRVASSVAVLPSCES
jgi:hypothetical protein